MEAIVSLRKLSVQLIVFGSLFLLACKRLNDVQIRHGMVLATGLSEGRQGSSLWWAGAELPWTGERVLSNLDHFLQPHFFH